MRQGLVSVALIEGMTSSSLTAPDPLPSSMGLVLSQVAEAPDLISCRAILCPAITLSVSCIHFPQCP